MINAPLILITACTEQVGVEFSDVSLSLSLRYVEAIKAAGGLSWIMPITVNPLEIAEYVRRSDGVMLTGGNDVHPGIYEKDVPSHLSRTVGPPDPHRDLMELHLVQEVFRQRKPLLAICRGHQILNVALGGNLWIDVSSQVKDALPHNVPAQKNALVHEVTLTPDSLMFKLFGKEKIGVNSSHHQAVAEVAKMFRVTAQSRDGVVEALEMNHGESNLLPFLLSVQFHPERLFGEHPEFLELFRSFIKGSRRML